MIPDAELRDELHRRRLWVVAPEILERLVELDGCEIVERDDPLAVVVIRVKPEVRP